MLALDVDDGLVVDVNLTVEVETVVDGVEAVVETDVGSFVVDTVDVVKVGALVVVFGVGVVVLDVVEDFVGFVGDAVGFLVILVVGTVFFTVTNGLLVVVVRTGLIVDLIGFAGGLVLIGFIVPGFTVPGFVEGRFVEFGFVVGGFVTLVGLAVLPATVVKLLEDIKHLKEIEMKIFSVHMVS